MLNYCLVLVVYIYFLRLAPKTYAAVCLDSNNDKYACKGVSHRTNVLHYEDYKSALYQGTIHYMENVTFKSAGGIMKTIRTKKRGLVNLCNKNYTNDDLITTRPFKKPKYIS